jgi:hypothetical protein
MRKLILVLLVCSISSAYCQFNNSWIDYSKTYYKFTLANDGLYRIPQSVIAGLGLSNINANDFQLWRNGEEVRIYTSVSNALLNSNDFIEFWGLMNDGKPDKPLYLNSDYQLSDRYSLENDTVSYFLTVNTSSPNLRYEATVNTAPSTATPDAYYMRDIDYFYKDYINRGEAKDVGEYVYSSSYDRGEGWSSNVAKPICCDVKKDFSSLNIYSTGPANSLSVRINAAGAAFNLRNLFIKVNQTEITTAPYGQAVPMNNFNYQKLNLTGLPLSLLRDSNKVGLTAGSTSANTTDRFVVSSVGLTFPAIFNFNNANNFSFKLEPNTNGNYLVISNFNFSNQQPVLYDITSGMRYLGEIASTSGKVKFVLPPSTQTRNFILVSQAVVRTIASATIKNFLDLRNANNQGNYIIISNPVLYNDGNGNNYVQEYAQYRNSIQGGSFNAKVYDINELYEQFSFGIKNHPASIRDFIRYASANFASTPTHVFLIGRGVDYVDQRKNSTNPILQQINLVPTFGWPPSDILLAANPGKFTPIVPIGRLSAIEPNEVKNYLTKMQEYELAQQTSSGSSNDKLWMKNFLHITGGSDTTENNQFNDYMNSYKRISEDTLIGAVVQTFSKTTTSVVQQISNQQIEDLFNKGISFMGYFGHSSANTFQFNLSNPQLYNNAGKYPFINVSGCSAGNYYSFDQVRVSGGLTLSEKYVLANHRGGIGFLADTHFGIIPFLNIYNTSLYKHFCQTNYGKSIGEQIKLVTQELGGTNSNIDFFVRMHLEQINLHGDPALKINYFSKPDYVVEDQMITTAPNPLSLADPKFNLKVKIYNIGKYVKDSLWVSVKLKLPNDSIIPLYKNLIPGFNNVYSQSYFPVNPYLLDTNITITPFNKGANQIIVELDTSNRVDELNEMNNAVTKEFYIYPDELKPLYPYNFSIINQQNLSYRASTSNQFNGNRTYKMEFDTTELFNSSFKKSYEKTGLAGLVEFQPTDIAFTDSTVYYWRVATVPLNNNPISWNTSSFVYLPNSSQGYNQSHYYQFLKSNYNNILLDSDRIFKFKLVPQDLIIRTGIYPYFNFDRINVNLGITQLEQYGCINFGVPGGYNNIQFYVFDTLTLTPWRNYNVTTTNGRFGSRYVCARGGDSTRAFFEFNYSDSLQRKSAISFIDSIPYGMYVAITNLSNTTNTSFINQWMNDTLRLGSGVSLYHKLKSIGFNKIDSLTRNLPFLYFYKKGNTSFQSTEIIGPTPSSYIDQSFRLLSYISDSGKIESPVYGPAGHWTSLHWRGFSIDNDPTADSLKVQVWGTGNSGVFNLLSTIYPAQDTSLAFVDSPFIKLVVVNKDKKYYTPNQLRYLRVNADMVPEGAISPTLSFASTDSVEQGQPVNMTISFKNVSDVAFDTTIKVKLLVSKSDNTTDVFYLPRKKALLPGDTINVNYKIDTRNYQYNNNWTLDINPDNDQREQFHFNNIWTNPFYVKKTDKYNPLLDVTFDGLHILNRDIVSSKPHILIKLKDENKFLALDDTSLMRVKVKFPDQTMHEYHFGDTMQFIPANLASGENTASIQFNPLFLEDGDYELIVSGNDVSGNNAGNLEYQITFSVLNKPMISNLLNYPNPFTTSTAFVFTLTGSDIPQNLRIQILTITGKVVKEITKNELGEIHIGRNITDYKWDGTDMYGQSLANGVYLYRVITNLNGKSLDKYKADGDNTDQFFKKGYGKMYLMR